MSNLNFLASRLGLIEKHVFRIFRQLWAEFWIYLEGREISHYIIIAFSSNFVGMNLSEPGKFWLSSLIFMWVLYF